MLTTNETIATFIFISRINSSTQPLFHPSIYPLINQQLFVCISEKVYIRHKNQTISISMNIRCLQQVIDNISQISLCTIAHTLGCFYFLRISHPCGRICIYHYLSVLQCNSNNNKKLYSNTFHIHHRKATSCKWQVQTAHTEHIKTTVYRTLVWLANFH